LLPGEAGAHFSGARKADKWIPAFAGRRRKKVWGIKNQGDLWMRRILHAGLTAACLVSAPALADDTPKHGGTLTFLIPADAPPSFDGHRETTFATAQSVAFTAC
jgi:hypothetical protein